MHDASVPQGPALADSGELTSYIDYKREISWSYDQLACDGSYIVKMTVVTPDWGGPDKTETEEIPFNFESEFLVPVAVVLPEMQRITHRILLHM